MSTKKKKRAREQSAEYKLKQIAHDAALLAKKYNYMHACCTI